MLREAESFAAEERLDAQAFASAAPAMAIALPMPAGPRYGEGRRLNGPALIVTAIIHIALLGALFMVRQHFVHKHHDQLTVMNLTQPAPPPPSTPEPRPVPVETPIVAPRPLIQVPSPAPTVTTTPDPVPPQPMALPAMPVAPGPPAPPTPAPAPSMVQASDLSDQAIYTQPPRMTLDSRRAREQGTVTLTIILGYDGKVSNISVARSSGFARLDRSALEAVRKWRWKPQVRNGQPVMVQGSVEISFVVQG